MQCPKCGTEILDDAQVCHSCSSSLTSNITQAPVLNRKTSGLAIISLVLAVINPFICLLTTLPAIIIGIISLGEIKKSAGRLKGKCFAIAAIAISTASLFIVLTIGILRPELLPIKQLSPRTTCSTNMSGLGNAMLIYAIDHDDKFPISSKWCDLLIEHTDVTPSTFRCKGTRKGPCNYAINRNIEKYNIYSPPDMVALFEAHPGWNQSGGPELLSTENHKGEGCNVLFMDSHVEFVRTKDLDKLRWKPE